MSDQKRILLIIGGGIAAYKALELIRLCLKADIADLDAQIADLQASVEGLEKELDDERSRTSMILADRGALRKWEVRLGPGAS